MLLNALTEKNVGWFFFIFWGHVFEFLIRFLFDVGQEHLVLLGYADSWFNINIVVETFIPLLVSQSVLTKTLYGTLLFVNRSKWILVFSLS